MRPVRAQSGFTLVELLVAMSAGLIVLAATLGFLVSAATQTRSVEERVDALDRASVGITRLRNELRHAIELQPAVAAETETESFDARVWARTSGGGYEQRWMRYDCSATTAASSRACVRTDLGSGQVRTLIEDLDPAAGPAFTLRPSAGEAQSGQILIRVGVRVPGASRAVSLEAAASPRPCLDGPPSGSATCPG